MVNRKFVPEEWEPSMFSSKEVKDIEEAWQYAAAVMSHFHVDQDIFKSVDDLVSFLLSDGEDDDDDEEEHLLTLSPIERLSTPEAYEDRNDIVQEAVRRDSRALVWASYRLRNNGDLWLPIVRRDATVVRYLTKQCRGDAHFCLQAVTANPEAIYYISRRCCYDPSILGAAWQGDTSLADARTYSGQASMEPLFQESFKGQHTGSLLRYATVMLGLDFERARNVARYYDCLEDFDRWENDLQVIQLIAKHHPEKFADLFTNISSSSSSLLDGRSNTGFDKSPVRHMHKSTPGTASTWNSSVGRARHVRKLSETQ